MDGKPYASPAAVQARLDYRRRHSGKTCSKCGEVRPLASFSPDPSKHDGLSKRCKPCESARRRASRRRV